MVALTADDIIRETRAEVAQRAVERYRACRAAGLGDLDAEEEAVRHAAELVAPPRPIGRMELRY